MDRLQELGWSCRCDTFITYSKRIHDYDIHVSRHITKPKWNVVLTWNDYDLTDEITLSYDADIDWVLELTSTLERAKM